MNTDASTAVSELAPPRVGDYLLNHPDFQRALKAAAVLLAVSATKVVMQHPAIRERMLAVAPELSGARRTIDLVLGSLAMESEVPS